MTVRRRGNSFEVIDGYHRLIVLKELGYTKIRCDVWDVNDRETKILLATLNRLRGADDDRKRALLIEDVLSEEMDAIDCFPESREAIDGLLSLLEEEGRNIDKEKGLVEYKLTKSGVDTDTAKMMAGLYRPPSSVPALTFFFHDQKDYNKAIEIFGDKPNVKLLMDLIKKNGNKKI